MPNKTNIATLHVAVLSKIQNQTTTVLLDAWKVTKAEDMGVGQQQYLAVLNSTVTSVYILCVFYRMYSTSKRPSNDQCKPKLLKLGPFRVGLQVEAPKVSEISEAHLRIVMP